MNKLILAIAGLLLPAIVVSAQISNFEVSHIYKTANSVYRIHTDDNHPVTDMLDVSHDSIGLYTTVDIAIQWPTRFGDHDITALQDTLLSRAFDVAPGTPVDLAIKQELARPIGYGEDELTVATYAQLDADTLCRRVVYNRSINLSTIGFCEKYIVYRCNHIEDRELWHPNLFRHFINYDMKTNRVIEFNDIFLPDHEQQLLEIITQRLLDKYYAVSLEELQKKSDIFADNIYVSREIYLTGDEVVFHYDPYEIGPWSIGEIDIHVPTHLLSDLLTDYARALFY